VVVPLVPAQVAITTVGIMNTTVLQLYVQALFMRIMQVGVWLHTFVSQLLQQA